MLKFNQLQINNYIEEMMNNVFKWMQCIITATIKGFTNQY